MHTCPSCTRAVVLPGAACPACGARTDPAAIASRAPVRAAFAATLALAALTGCPPTSQDLYGVALNDLDGDGYYEGDDCDDENAAVNPGATEDPSNGVDDDCDGDIDEAT